MPKTDYISAISISDRIKKMGLLVKINGFKNNYLEVGETHLQCQN